MLTTLYVLTYLMRLLSKPVGPNTFLISDFEFLFNIKTSNHRQTKN